MGNRRTINIDIRIRIAGYSKKPSNLIPQEPTNSGIIQIQINSELLVFFNKINSMCI